MKIKPLFRFISAALTIAFICQDVVWADPEIFQKAYSASTLQVPTIFQLGRANKATLEATIKYLIEILPQTALIDTEKLKFRLTPKIGGADLELLFNSRYLDNTGRLIIPCSFTENNTYQKRYAVVNLNDKSVTIERARPATAEEKTSTNIPESPSSEKTPPLKAHVDSLKAKKTIDTPTPVTFQPPSAAACITPPGQSITKPSGAKWSIEKIENPLLLKYLIFENAIWGGGLIIVFMTLALAPLLLNLPMVYKQLGSGTMGISLLYLCFIKMLRLIEFLKLDIYHNDLSLFIFDGDGNWFRYKGPVYDEHGYEKSGVHLSNDNKEIGEKVNELARKHGLQNILVTACNEGSGEIGKINVPCIHSNSRVEITGIRFMPIFARGVVSGDRVYSENGWSLVMPSGEEIDLNDAWEKGLLGTPPIAQTEEQTADKPAAGAAMPTATDQPNRRQFFGDTAGAIVASVVLASGFAPVARAAGIKIAPTPAAATGDADDMAKEIAAVRSLYKNVGLERLNFVSPEEMRSIEAENGYESEYVFAGITLPKSGDVYVTVPGMKEKVLDFEEFARKILADPGFDRIARRKVILTAYHERLHLALARDRGEEIGLPEGLKLFLKPASRKIDKKKKEEEEKRKMERDWTGAGKPFLTAVLGKETAEKIAKNSIIPDDNIAAIKYKRLLGALKRCPGYSKSPIPYEETIAFILGSMVMGESVFGIPNEDPSEDSSWSPFLYKLALIFLNSLSQKQFAALNKYYASLGIKAEGSEYFRKKFAHRGAACAGLGAAAAAAGATPDDPKLKASKVEWAFSELTQGGKLALDTYSNVSRGDGTYSLIATGHFEEAGNIIADYLGVDTKNYTLILTDGRRAEMIKDSLAKDVECREIKSNDIGLPFGIVALAVPRGSLQNDAPFVRGGGTVKIVGPDFVIWADAPDKHQAGTPNIPGMIMFAKALKIIKVIGDKNIFKTREPESTADAILGDNSWAGDLKLPKKELLARFKKSLIGRSVSVPTTMGMSEYINLDIGASAPTFLPIWDVVLKTLRQPKNVLGAVIRKVEGIVFNFFGAKEKDFDLIFTSNTTDGINIVAEHFTGVVLNTAMEHNSNELPWRYREGVRLERLNVDKEGFVDTEELAATLAKHNHPGAPESDRIKLVAITGASNVLGSINDIAAISEVVHRYGAKLLVDAAQLAAHRKIDMGDEESGIDFLVYSGHKIYAPFGSGALLMRKSAREQILNL